MSDTSSSPPFLLPSPTVPWVAGLLEVFTGVAVAAGDAASVEFFRRQAGNTSGVEQAAQSSLSPHGAQQDGRRFSERFRVRLLGLSGLLAALAEAALDDVATGPRADSVWINAMSRK